MVIVGGLPVAQDGRLFNGSALLQKGLLLGVVPKTFLPGYQEFYEERWFSSAREAQRSEVRLAGGAGPLGTARPFRGPAGAGGRRGVGNWEGPTGPSPPPPPHRRARGHGVPHPPASP